MYIWTHASTPGTTALQTREEPLQREEALHVSFVRRNQTTFPLPNIPRTVRRLRASAVLLFYTDKINRVCSSEEAPRSFAMAPCVVVERLEGKQRCSRAAVSEHAGIQAREWSRWLFTKKREVNEKTTKSCNSPHTITTVRRPDAVPRQHLAHLHWCGADPPSS